ncbi:PREDICTED: myoneurin isoform X1 [Polistes canadensis]|uniref:myoneurin isoform X1 n=2 Tax=Polistes canadensis TaxID=91411 RepID=UPI000718CF55|nr:PREDICTED: myoneurin isoform X1 [Polistes canadensis]
MEGINIYEKITSEELINTTCTESYGNDTEFVILNKCTTVDDNMVVGEEVEVNGNVDLHQRNSLDGNCSLENISTSADDNIHTCNKEITDCVETCSIISSTSSNIKDNLSQINDEESTMLPNMMKEVSTIDYCNNTDDESQGDDETIAMFVTAAGQQLALYAVEDSEDIFAVSLYDESGEPPTNFQFLMKVDVERLIGEGAVRTVKKPSQIKKHLLTTQSSVLLSKECLLNQEAEDDIAKDIVHDNYQIKGDQTPWIKRSCLSKKNDAKHDVSLNMDFKSEDSNVTYVTMDDCTMMLDSSSVDEDNNEQEILVQSTVQYIFFEDNESESELTFDEVQSTLKNMKHQRRTFSKKSCTKTKVDDESVKLDVSSSKMIISNGTESDDDRLNANKNTEECSQSKPIHTEYKAKRPRKQQLTSVNREDSEIIIQPASLLTENDKSTKSRGKRRRFTSPSEYHGKRNNSKNLMRMKQRVIEIINIDLDEDENMSPVEKNIVEITIDENKDKYSSDKENDIIMVGDSEDEVKENVSKHTGTLMQCEFCSRRFRQKRALDTHSRVCSKSSSDVVKLDSQNLNHVNNVDKKKNTKLYACKICQEKFEVVVALARHVRLEHSQRKRRISSKSSGEPDSDESYSMDVTKENVRIHKRTKKKRDHAHSWETNKLCCKDCGRWFSSAASLSTHYLKHDTKRPEKQIRRCEICKKLIKSRILYIRHLKMHNNVKLYAGMNALQKKLRSTRQPTRKLMALRKRGRPRKL